MKGAAAIVAMLAGCGRAPAPVTIGSRVPPPVPPLATIAFAGGASVQLVEVRARGGAKVVREVATPYEVAALDWFHDQPIVMLGAQPCGLPMPPDDGGCTASADPKLEGVIGRITARGFVAYPRLPDATWAGLAAPGGNSEECTIGCWSMTVTADGGVYQGHCRSVFPADGAMVCDAWLYARIDRPGPPLTELPKPPPAPAPAHATAVKPAPPPPPPAVSPSPRVALALVAQDQEARYGGKLTQLRCTLGADTTTYPALADLDLGMGEQPVRWLTTEPPRFLAKHGHDGMVPHDETVLYEGCTPRTIDDPIEGPDDMIIVDGVLYQRGAVLGAVPGARLVAFAP